MGKRLPRRRYLSVPRASVRSNGDAGFIFFNNYVRNYSMATRRSAQFFVRLLHGTLAVPRHPSIFPQALTSSGPSTCA